jgi:serine/threonine protein phosphatase 1
LQGNHEAALIESVRGDEEAKRHWLAFGGAETLASYGIERPREGDHAGVSARQIVERLGADTLRWIEGLPRFLHIPPFFFCHAGIRPGHPLSRQSDVYLQWIREPFLEDTRYHGAIVVHGHSMSDEVTVRSNRIGLDTGAYRTGVLSAAILDNRRNWIVSVRAIMRPEHDE